VDFGKRKRKKSREGKKTYMYMRTIPVYVMLAVCSAAADSPFKTRQKVSGITTETILPREAAPNDPFGRVVGTFTGSLGGASTAAVTAFLASPPAFSGGGLATATAIQVKQAWVTAPGDVFTTAGKAFFNVAPGHAAGRYHLHV
jgi:hypothetical protein